MLRQYCEALHSKRKRTWCDSLGKFSQPIEVVISTAVSPLIIQIPARNRAAESVYALFEASRHQCRVVQIRAGQVRNRAAP